MLKNIKVSVCLTKYGLSGGVTPFNIYKGAKVVLPDGTCLSGGEGAMLFQPHIVRHTVSYRTMYGWETGGLREENGEYANNKWAFPI